MLKFLKKSKEELLYAPVSGKCIELEKVPDKVFASKMMGEGVAFIYDQDIVCAPCDGELTLIANTLHAFGIKAKNGAEILVHIGLDTVNLNGKGFTKLKEQGTSVKVGEPIIKIDHSIMEEAGIDLTTPLIITNSSEFTVDIKNVNQDVEKGKDIVVLLK